MKTKKKKKNAYKDKKKEIITVIIHFDDLIFIKQFIIIKSVAYLKGQFNKKQNGTKNS